MQDRNSEPLSREERKAISRRDELTEYVGPYGRGYSPITVALFLGVALLAIGAICLGGLYHAFMEHTGICLGLLAIVGLVFFVLYVHGQRQKARLEEALYDIDSSDRPEP